MGTGQLPELGNPVVFCIMTWRIFAASTDQRVFRQPSAYNKAFTAQKEVRVKYGLVAVTYERASRTHCAARHFTMHPCVSMVFPHICFLYAVLFLFNKLWEATAVAPQFVYNKVADIARGLQ